MAKALDEMYYASEGLHVASFFDKLPKDEVVSPDELVKAGLLCCGPGDSEIRGRYRIF